MSVRVLTLISLAAGAAALSGCVVVPTEPGYGHGGPVYHAPPAAVIVAPPPRYWGGYYGRRYYDGGYDRHR